MSKEWNDADSIVRRIKEKERQYDSKTYVVSTRHGLMKANCFKVQREIDGLAELASMIPDTY
jgi:hypothetical protein